MENLAILKSQFNEFLNNVSDEVHEENINKIKEQIKRVNPDIVNDEHYLNYWAVRVYFFTDHIDDDFVLQFIGDYAKDGEPDSIQLNFNPCYGS